MMGMNGYNIFSSWNFVLACVTVFIHVFETNSTSCELSSIRSRMVEKSTMPVTSYSSNAVLINQTMRIHTEMPSETDRFKLCDVIIPFRMIECRIGLRWPSFHQARQMQIHCSDGYKSITATCVMYTHDRTNCNVRIFGWHHHHQLWISPSNRNVQH